MNDEYQDRIEKVGNIQVTINDSQQAKLVGSVKTERARQLAIGLAMLEPGITSVDDQLVVQPEEPADIEKASTVDLPLP